MKYWITVAVLFFQLCSLSAQTFTFECFCGYLTAADSNCDVCTSSQQSRYFKGLLIYKNGAAFKWIEQPYTILQNFNSLTFKELIPNAEQIRIELSGTAFDSIQQFRDSVMCPCAGGVGVLTLVAGPGINLYGDTIASIPQQIDTFDLVSGAQDTIRLSLTRDSVPFHFVILPPDSDNQYIDTLQLTGTTLEISLFGDNLPLSTVDLSSLIADGSETIVTGANGITVTGTGTSGNPYVVGMPAGTNTQTLRHNGSVWLANSLLTNDGSNLGVNSAPSSAALLRIKHASDTDGIELERDTDTRKLKMYQDASAFVETTASNLFIRAAGGQLLLYGPGGGGFINQIDVSTQSNVTSNFGNSALFRLSATYAPTTSGGDFGFLKFLPTINQTGTSNQDIYFMDFVPTLTNVTGTLYGVRYWPSIGRAFWQPNGAGVVINHFAGNTGIGSGSTSPAQTLHVQGTARITGSDGTPTSVVGRDGDGDISALGLSGLSIVSGTLTVTADGDGSSTNEGILGVAAGGSNDALLTSNTAGANGVTYAGGTGIGISETPSSNGGTITVTNTGDLSPANELQTLANTSDATSHTVTLSNSGGSIQLVEGSGISLATTGTGLDGIVTLSTDPALGLNGIYGDGTAGSGSNTLPPGGSTVTIPGQWQPLSFSMASSASTVWTGLRVNTAYCADDAISKYLVGKSPVDSLEIYNFDCGGVIKNTGGSLTLESSDIIYQTADSIAMTLLPTKTTLPFVVGQGAGNIIQKIAGTSNGQILKWNSAGGGFWELGTDNAGSGPSGSGAAGQSTFWTGASTISGDNQYWWDNTNKRLGLGVSAGTPSAQLEARTNSLGTTQTTTAGAALTNTTSAAAGAQQISPAIRWTGQGWKTNATAASQSVEFRAYATPVQGTTAPSGYLGFGSAVNGSWTNDQFALSSGGEVGLGHLTFSGAGLVGKLNVNAGSGAFTPFVFNTYASSSSGGVVYGQLSNTQTASTTIFSLNEAADINTVRAGLRRFGSTHASRANELNLTTFGASSPVTIGTNDAVRLTAAADGTVHATNKLAAGYASTTGVHSTLQSAGSIATAYLETVGAPTFDDTKRTVVYTASTNISWTLPTAAACNCPGREYILHHAGSAGTITLSQTIAKGNTGTFNTLTAGQWAYIIYSSSGIRGYKITSL